MKNFWFTVWSSYAGMSFGFIAWAFSGCDPLLLPSFMCGGIAWFCTTTAFVLWRQRSRRASEGGLPEESDRPGAALPRGTSVERSQDLRAYCEGRISLEEYLDRWSGRPVIDIRQMLRRNIAAAVAAELVRPAGLTEKLFRCKHCLGLHEAFEKCPVVEAHHGAGQVGPCMIGAPGDIGSTESSSQTMQDEYEAANALIKSAFNFGQWVRVKPGGMHGLKLVRLCGNKYLAHMLLWTFDCDEGEGALAEVCFEAALPKKGEVWTDAPCDTHSKGGGPPHVFIIERDWDEASMGMPYIRCGCIRPMNYGHGEGPRTGAEYVLPKTGSEYKPGDKVRVRGGSWDDRIVTLVGRPDSEQPRWCGTFGGAIDFVNERTFEHAVPKIGEVWNYKKCESCERVWDTTWPEHCFDVTYEWHESDVMTRCRVRCGCLYRIGTV